jgi:hypothetical protein
MIPPSCASKGASVRPTFTLHVHLKYASYTYFYLYINYNLNLPVLHTLCVRDALCVQDRALFDREESVVDPTSDRGYSVGPAAQVRHEGVAVVDARRSTVGILGH